MKITLQNFSGFFQVELHKPSTRLLWILSVISCLTVIIFGIWGLSVDFFGLRHNIKLHFFAIALVVFLTIVLPALVLIIGLPKMRQKAGVYLRGVRATNQGFEIGTLTLDLDSTRLKNLWGKLDFDNIVAGDWTQEKNISNKAIDIVIVLRAQANSTNFVFFERLIVLSREKILYQLIEKNSNENVLENLVALSNGSFQLIENTNGTYPNYLMELLEVLANIISICRPSRPPHCTLKIVTSPIKQGNALATGILGGLFIPERVKDSRGKNTLEILFDANFSNFLRNFLRERNWSYSIE
jgi:hypothetical protein